MAKLFFFITNSSMTNFSFRIKEHKYTKEDMTRMSSYFFRDRVVFILKHKIIIFFYTPQKI